MDKSECAWCAAEIDAGGEDHKGMLFCSAECIEEWDADDIDETAIDLDDLGGMTPLIDDYADFDDVLPVDEDAVY